MSFLDSIKVVGNWPTSTIQKAVDDAAGSGFSVIIPSTYFGKDTYVNPSGVCIIDFRQVKNGGTGMSGPIAGATGTNWDCGTF